MSKTAIDSSYLETADIETSSEDYASRFAGAVGKWFLEVQEMATLALLSEYPGASVLDVGGGHGQVTEPLITNGYDLTVLGSGDICATRIRSFVEQGKCQFKVGDMLELPFANQSFDVVLSYRLLPHVERWMPYLAEMARVARYAVVLDYPEIRSINQLVPFLFPLKKRMEGNTRPFNCFYLAELIKIFATYDYELVDRRPQFFFPMVLHRLLKKPQLSALAENAAHRVGLTRQLGTPVIVKFSRTR